MKTKRCIAAVLALCIILFWLPAVNVTAQTHSGTCGDNLTWTLDENGTLTISGEGEMTNYRTNNAPWQAESDKVNSVVIESGVTTIGNSAFRGCSNLISVTIPESVTSIGSSAFSYCESLNSVTIPKKVTYIGDSAFSFCSGLTKVNIGESVTHIGIYAFQNCSRLISIIIPEGVTSISYSTFFNCSSLISVTIPEGITSIEAYAFHSCTRLTSVVIPDSVTSIGNNAFFECSSLWHVLYTGAEAQWNEISIGYQNSKLTSATRHYECTGDEIVNGVCSICNPYIPGDLDGNDTIDTDDAIHLLYFTLFGEANYPVNQDCDFNSDGMVDTDDAIYLLYHTLFGEENYPLD